MLGGYTLHQKIGEGGYSTVRKCTDRIGIRYACKVLTKDQNKRQRVTHEVQMMKLLTGSPKLIQFVDAGEDDTSFYIVQEWCRGGSVQDYIQTHRNYGENTVASIVRGTLRGLYHMHEKGVIHADIKCGNIFLADTSDDADVKIGDFGTAILSEKSKLVEVSKLVGTPVYMAPENLRFQYHPTSDIWSLGVVTYQLLCGVTPFDAPYISQIWNQIFEKEPSMHGPNWDGVSADAKDFVASCLKKEWKERPQDAIECLTHPWLTRTDCSDRFRGTPLHCIPLFENCDAMTINLQSP